MTDPRDTIAWARGGIASVETARDIHLSVASTVAYPPGAPAVGSLTPPEGAPLPFTLKVTGSRRRDDRWVVSGRLISASAALRAAFAAAVPQPPAPAPAD